jgi:hypothetical protein
MPDDAVRTCTARRTAGVKIVVQENADVNAQVAVVVKIAVGMMAGAA